MLTILLGVLVASYFILFRPLYDHFRHAANARRLGCQPPRTFKVDRLYLGIYFLRRIRKADRDSRLCEEMMSMFEENDCNTFENWIGCRRQIWTAEPKDIQAILATKFSDFALTKQREGTFMPMFGKGIFSANGKFWEHSRAMLRPQFTRQQVANLELEERHLQDLMLHIKPDEASGWTGPVDLKPMFFRLTIDSSTEFFFGQSVHSQLEALPGGMPNSDKHQDYAWRSLVNTFAKHFDNGTMHVGLRGRFGSLYWLHNPSDFKESSKRVQEFADYFVQEALRRTAPGNEKDGLEKGKADGEKGQYTFLYELIEETRDPIMLRNQLLHILLAGRDTTAGLLGWVFFLLARHPDVYQKLRTIVLDTFGTYESPRDLTFEQLKGCTYLQHVMQETLRIYPMVPLNGRRATADVCLPVGGGPQGKSPLYIKKDQVVNYSVYAMHRREDLWGPDALKFDPERWTARKPGWEYLPFNGGPRICLGQQFALTEAGYVITRMVQLFDKIEAVDPNEPVVNQVTLTSMPKRVLLNMHKAE